MLLTSLFFRVSLVLLVPWIDNYFLERGLGPKLFGFFEGGRMEEFIPSKTLNADDVLKPE